MDTRWIRYLIIFILVYLLQLGARAARNRFAKPKTTDGVQKPGGFDRLLVRILIGLAIFSGLFTILGAFMGEMEMAIVFAVMTAIFTAISLWLRYEYDMTYEENTDYFIYKAKNKTYEVHYENIANWTPGHNEIQIYDETREDNQFIPVNISVFKPDILLRKMADMTFQGKFAPTVTGQSEDSNRKYEIINFLITNNYSYLVEDYIKQLEN